MRISSVSSKGVKLVEMPANENHLPENSKKTKGFAKTIFDAAMHFAKAADAKKYKIENLKKEDRIKNSEKIELISQKVQELLDLTHKIFKIFLDWAETMKKIASKM